MGPNEIAVNHLRAAWKHLARRRTKGDNEARRLLRSNLSELALAFTSECLRSYYAPALIAQQNELSVFLKNFATRELQ